MLIKFMNCSDVRAVEFVVLYTKFSGFIEENLTQIKIWNRHGFIHRIQQLFWVIELNIERKLMVIQYHGFLFFRFRIGFAFVVVLGQSQRPYDVFPVQALGLKLEFHVLSGIHY